MNSACRPKTGFSVRIYRLLSYWQRNFLFPQRGKEFSHFTLRYLRVNLEEQYGK